MLSLYAGLLEQGWTMQDIDEMDLLYFLDARIYRAKHPKTGSREKATPREQRGASNEDVVIVTRGSLKKMLRG